MAAVFPEIGVVRTLFAYLRQGREVLLWIITIALIIVGFGLPDWVKGCELPQPFHDALTNSALIWALTWGARMLGAWLLIWRLLRFKLWLGYHQRGQVMRICASLNEGKLLPGQQEFVDGLEKELRDFSLNTLGPTIALRGEWGSGKSHVINVLLDRLNKKDKGGRLAAVFFSVWREQSRRDLHLAIVEAILSHPTILRYCFAAYPNRLITRKIIHAFAQWLPRGLRFSYSGVDGQVDPRSALPLMAQKDLEQVAAYACTRGLRIVLFLDEADRATTEVAQAALVLTKRALNLQGLAVVVAYVENQLHKKVFDPRHDHVMELHQTFLTNIEHQLGPAQQNQLSKADKLIETAVNSDAAGVDQASRLNIAQRYWEWQRLQRDEYLANLFLSQKLRVQKQLVSQSESKYLSRRLDLPALRPDEIADVFAFDSIYHNLPGEEFRKIIQERQENGWKTFVAEVTDRLQKMAGGNLAAPTIRVFEGRLYNWLPHLKDDPKLLERFKTHPGATLASLAAIAWRSAQQQDARKY